MSNPHSTKQDALTPTGTGSRPRLWIIDALRGVALIAMATYHFSWDLANFHYLDPVTVGTGAFKIYARGIASSFLFLAGFSLVLGQYPVFRTRPFLIRLAKIVAAAALVTVATYFIFPDAFIFFGILHSIAAASIIGLAFLRLPPLLTIVVGLAVLVAPLYLRSPVFDIPALWWVGLSETLPRSNDYVPLLPWLAPFLFGIAAARIARTTGFLERLRSDGSGRIKTGLATLGRYSLSFYLIHQPVLFALVAGFAWAFPPDEVALSRPSCVATCTQENPAAFCEAFCDCALNALSDQGVLKPLNEGQVDGSTDERVIAVQNQCTASAQALR